MVMKERDEELTMFLEMRRREKENEKNNLLLLHSSDELDAPLGSNGGASPISKIVSAAVPRKTATENFLNSENEKSDYDWLLTPPGTPLFPSLEMESQKMAMHENGMPNARPTSLKSRLPNISEEPPSRNSLAPKNQMKSSAAGNRRPSSSGGPTSASRAATPNGRPTLLTVTKPSRSSTPTSRATVPAATKPLRSSTPTARATLPVTSKPSRSSTPTSRATLPSIKSTASAVRSSTPTRSTARSSTPTARPMLPSSKSMSRPGTPTQWTAKVTSTASASAPASHSTSLPKTGATTLKSSAPSRGTSPTVKSRPWNPSEMPGFSLDTPPNLRTSLPERPASASRGRPGAPSARSSSVEGNSNGRPRRQSCSPSRGRTSSGSINSIMSSIRSARRTDSNSGDNESPVVIGTKMVERVVNMRKLAPPKQDDSHLVRNNPTAKLSTSLDSSGFGRTLSKKSLDMALRHMDIRRSAPGKCNLRPLMTNIPASSMYSVRSASTQSRTISVSDSPLATSSNASEPSVNNNSMCYGSEMEDNDLGSERGNSSPARHHAC